MNPGIEIPALASLTGINLHTLRYHLGYLVHMKKIACIEQGSGYHFFENHGRYNQADQQRILYRRYPTTNQILSVIGANPGITTGRNCHGTGACRTFRYPLDSSVDCRRGGDRSPGWTAGSLLPGAGVRQSLCTPMSSARKSRAGIFCWYSSCFG